MTPPTKEQCVQWAYECNADLSFTGDLESTICTMSARELQAFALKVLAEKELEVLKLREALEEAVNEIGGWVEIGGSCPQKAIDALSTTPSTEALDEYVAARMAESEDRRDAERGNWYIATVANSLGITEQQMKDDLDAAIEAEKVSE